ncbi:MAG: hypothetical protein ABSB33_14495 [Tepidisphaeraceae bacterium]|jgi:hypothetical protein
MRRLTPIIIIAFGVIVALVATVFMVSTRNRSSEKWEYGSLTHRLPVEAWFFQESNHPEFFGTDQRGGMPESTPYVNDFIKQLGGPGSQHGISDEQTILDALGASGWELVSHEHFTNSPNDWEEWIFKRPK